MAAPLLSLDAALQLLARPPWVKPVDGGTRRALPPLAVAPAAAEHGRAMAATLRGDDPLALLAWLRASPETAAASLLAAGTRDAWMALRIAAVHCDGGDAVARVATRLGVAEAVAAAQLDDPLLCHPLEFPQLPARLPAVTLRADLQHPRRGQELGHDELRRLVELFGFARVFAPHVAWSPLRAALVPESRDALAQALLRHPDHTRAATRLGDDALGERVLARAMASGRPEPLCDALAAADPMWLCRMVACDSQPMRRWARGHVDALVAPTSVDDGRTPMVVRAHVDALERAMVERRRFTPAALHRAARHPVLAPLLGALVLGCYVDDVLVKWFRLDAQGVPVDHDGQPFEPSGPIGICHPLELPEHERRALADGLEGQQPFAQLRRPLFVPMPDGRPDPAALAEAMVPARLLALADDEWRRISDGASLRAIARTIRGGLEVAVELAAVPFRDLDAFASGPSVMGTVVLGEPASRDASGVLQHHVGWAAWSHANPIEFSEVIREIASCLVRAHPSPEWIDPTVLSVYRQAIRRAPTDREPVLALAQLLRKHHHPEGELLELDLREREGTLDDPDAIERLLALAAAHGFPREPDDPDGELLVFRPRHGTHYVVTLGGREHAIGYDAGVLTVDDGAERRTLRPRLAARDHWSDIETNVILALTLAVFRERRGLDALWLPPVESFGSHPRARLGPWPLHPFPAGVRRLAFDPAAAIGLRARDRQRWTMLWHRLQALLGDRTPQRL